MPLAGPAEQFQFEADLLAEGRIALERWCRSRRYRHLYPEGPNLAVLLSAYQELDRQRAVGRVRGGLRRHARALRKILRKVARRDALGRNLRLLYRYPAPRPQQFLAPPEIVARALDRVDTDARPLVHARLFGARVVPDPSLSIASEAHTESRGLAQFRDALVNECLAHPAAIVSLHPQYLLFAASGQPERRRHPIASYLLVKLPLQLVASLVTLLVVAYLGAWVFFNDEVLGDFVSDRVSGLVEGELRMGSIHWGLPAIYDLVTGRPSYIVVEDVTVWEPYHSFGGERLQPAAHADNLRVRLVLHEIIPWNRLGIPTALEIPWVLHFTDVQTEDPAWFVVRQYDTVDDKGDARRLIGLRDAFVLVRPLAPGPNLSFAVDQARLARTEVDIDFDETGRWRTQLALSSATLGLRFTAPEPAAGPPLELPLVLWLEAAGRQGGLRIDDIEIPLRDLSITRFTSGLAGTPLADFDLSATVEAAGSPVTLYGGLDDAFVRKKTTDAFGELTRVSLTASTADAGELTAHLLRELDLEPNTVDARHVAVTAKIEGPLADPRYEIVAEGLTLDPLDEPAWTLDDVAMRVAIVTELSDDDATPHKVFSIDELTGAALDGTVTLHDDTPVRIDMPGKEGEPWRLAMDLAFEGIDPAHLLPADPDAAAMLGGSATGRIDIRQLVLAPANERDPARLERAEIDVHDTVLVRDRGPEQDGLPRRLEARGTITIDEHGAIDFEDLRLGTDGGFLEADGGIEGGMDRIRDTLLRVRIDRGPAFSRALGIDRYFDTLRADLQVHGPMFAPSSRPGTLRVTGVGDPGAPPTDATLRLEDGVLFVHTDNAHLFGSTGTIDAKAVLFDKGALLDKPRVSAEVALDGVRIEQVLGPSAGMTGVVDLRVKLDDGEGRPAPISGLTIRGTARASKLRFGGTLYRNVELDFTLLPDKLHIERLVLPIHRPVSPVHRPDATIAIGELVVRGDVGLRRDPALDLHVAARGVPIGVVTRLLEVDAPIRGQIAEGTELHVGGTAARPKVEGNVELLGLSSSGLQLGSGRLEVTSSDFSRQGPLAAHRELRARGELATASDGGAGLQWTVDAVVAFGESHRDASPPIDAEVDVSFDRVSIGTLLATADRDPADAAITGRLEGIGGHVLACNPRSPMLSACLEPGEDRPALAIDLQVDRVWVSGTGLREDTPDPCAHASTLCSEDVLAARLDWPRLELSRPWSLAMGKDGAARLTVTGGVDLSSDAAPVEAAVAAMTRCRPPPLTSRPEGRRRATARSAGPRAEIRGVVDLRALAPLLAGAGIDLEIQRGQLDLDLGIEGKLGDPRVSGRITLVEVSGAGKNNADAIAFKVPGIEATFQIRDLDLRISDDWLTVAGVLAVAGEELRFGSVRGQHTGYAIAGDCAGHYAVAGEGTVSAALLNALAGSTIAPRGGVDVTQAIVAGNARASPSLQRAEGTLRFGRNALRLDINEGIEGLELTSGRIDIAVCTAEGASRCGGVPEGTIAVHVGGVDGAAARTRPTEALRAKVGPKGQAFAWGTAFLAPDFTHFEGSDVHVQMRNVPYRDYDDRGRPVFEMEMSSDDVRLQGGDPLVVSGSIALDRARYVKDAIEGVNLLAFTDSVPVPEAPPPEIVRTVQLDLHVQTESLARLENNIAHRVGARLAIDVTGSYEHPELVGRIDIEPGGTVDIPFVTGTYEIQHGRVDLVGEFDHAEVDVLALRLEPVYVEGAPRRISLLLGGTVSAITWDCIVAGDTSGAAETQRGCLEYLVLGAGDVAVSDLDVRRLGGGGLMNARKPLQVVGHVTEFDFGKRIEEAAPRYRTYVPDIEARLGQIGPELEISSPEEWLDFDYGHATFGWHYTRGYPGFLLRQSRKASVRLEILDPVSIEFSRDIRDYLNERIIFDPLRQRTIELKFDFEIPSLR